MSLPKIKLLNKAIMKMLDERGINENDDNFSNEYNGCYYFFDGDDNGDIQLAEFQLRKEIEVEKKIDSKIASSLKSWLLPLYIDDKDIFYEFANLILYGDDMVEKIPDFYYSFYEQKYRNILMEWLINFESKTSKMEEILLIFARNGISSSLNYIIKNSIKKQVTIDDMN